MEKDKHLIWERVGSEYLLQEEYITVRADRCKMPNGKIIDPYYILEYPDYVNVFALTDDHKVIINRQYRHGIEKVCWELPSGTVDPGELPIDASRRELLEETGYSCDKIDFLASVSPNPTNHDNLNFCFLATGCTKVAEQDLDPSEQIDIVLLEISEVKELLFTNQFAQALHVSSLFYALKALDAI